MSSVPIQIPWPRPFNQASHRTAAQHDGGPSASPVRPEPLGILLGRIRRAAGLSQNALARASGVDPAVICRLEQRRTIGAGRPSREVLLKLWAACHADDDDRERLLVAAGLCPQAIILAGGWDAYVAGWFSSLEQPQRTHFRQLERRLDLARAALREQARRIARLRRELAGDLVRVEA